MTGQPTAVERRRTALVTGASGTIGSVAARRLADAGFDLTIVGRRAESLSSLAIDLMARGASVTQVVGDMRRDDDVIAAAETHIAAHSDLDCLLMCAGTGVAGSFYSCSMAAFDKQMHVNVRAPLLLTQRLLPALCEAAERDARGSRVIAIASITGVAADPELAAYGASKAALISLCESITVEMGTRGISATAISPGYVDTDMSGWVRDRIEPQHMISADDVGEMVHAIVHLSRWVAIPNIVMTRPGPQIWRA